MKYVIKKEEQKENGFRIPLVITGCISPMKTQKYLLLYDEEERLRQYVDCIEYFIKYSSFTSIVFCDNSNYSYDHSKLDSVANKMNKKLEWLSFEGDLEKIAKQGKGFGEGEILEYALNNSQILLNSVCFAKLTGRLKISNIEQICKSLMWNCNYFNYDIYRSAGIDTRFYVCNKELYNSYLRKLYQNVEDVDGNAIEDCFYKALTSRACLQEKFECLPCYPKFSGISAGNGRDYSRESKIIQAFLSFLCSRKKYNQFISWYSKSFFQKMNHCIFKIQYKVRNIVMTCSCDSGF